MKTEELEKEWEAFSEKYGSTPKVKSIFFATAEWLSKAEKPQKRDDTEDLRARLKEKSVEWIKRNSVCSNAFVKDFEVSFDNW